MTTCRHKSYILRSALLLIVPLIVFSSCSLFNFKKEADKKFADQYFKTAVNLIEIYHVRYGQYPRSLDSITFMGDWDRIMFGYVEYERLDTGYRLDLTDSRTGLMHTDLSYPPDFWHGLGLRKSNLLNKNGN
ncbi:MAG: hypothetical protein JST90_13505 [Bacteroidetes bacterium]|nr:hypothetical protein [Bacteroidota bacterium]